MASRRRVGQKASEKSATPIRIPLEIKKSEERWSEFELSDGSLIRVRPIMIEARRLKGKYNPNGEPIYEIKQGLIVDVRVPDNLKLKQI